MATAATASAARFTAVGTGHGFRWRTSSWTHRAFFPNRRVAAPLRCRRHFLAPAALHKPDFQIKEEGQSETLDYRVFFLDGSGKKISPWHDVPLHLGDGVFNFIVEIPKDTSAKMEVATDEPYTPIKQDTKKGKLRYYPYNINWNYGLLPQTWEDPSFANSEVEGALGDNDPVDVVEIGETQAKMGAILKVNSLAPLLPLQDRLMGICLSSASLEKQECDENVVYVVEEEGFNYGEGAVRMLASLYSRQGKKGPNQDAAILCTGYGIEEGVFCGVFDGHGRSGHVVSRQVRDYLPSLLLSQRDALLLAEEESDDSSDGNDTSSVDADDSSISSPEMFDEWKTVCIQAFRIMDKELKLLPNLDCSFSGTTAVSIIKQGEDLIIANLGDSRAIMGTISDEGRLEAIQLTTDLKPSVPKEAERIRKNNGRIFSLKDEPHTQRVWLPNQNFPGLAMARAFGDFQLKNYGVISIPQVSYRRLSERDQFIVLATDGVWDVLSNERVVSIVWSAKSKEDASKALVEAAVRAWKSKFPTSKVDDCSAACLFLQDRWQGQMIPRVERG